MSNGDPDPAATEKLKQNEAAVKKYITDNNLAVQQHASGFYFQINNSNQQIKFTFVVTFVALGVWVLIN